MKKLLIPALLLLASCLGTKARHDVLLPAMAESWPGVRADVEVGTSDPIVLDEAKAMSAALDAGDPVAVGALPWPPLRDAATHGVEVRLSRNEVGPHGAELLRDRITQFGEALTRLQ